MEMIDDSTRKTLNEYKSRWWHKSLLFIHLSQCPFCPSLSHFFALFVCETHKDKSRDVITGFQAYSQWMTLTMKMYWWFMNHKTLPKNGPNIASMHLHFYFTSRLVFWRSCTHDAGDTWSNATPRPPHGLVSNGRGLSPRARRFLYGPRCYNWVLI